MRRQKNNSNRDVTITTVQSLVPEVARVATMIAILLTITATVAISIPQVHAFSTGSSSVCPRIFLSTKKTPLSSSFSFATPSIASFSRVSTTSKLFMVPSSQEKNVENGNSIDTSPQPNDSFWQQQRQLLQEMTSRTESSLRNEQLNQFRTVQSKLLQETAFVSAMLFSLLWLACDNPFVPFSYVFGALFGLAYTYGLGKYVETIGGTVEDASAVQGAGVGQARFAFLILLFVLVGKLRGYGLLEIPSIAGFFTYQIASLTQGLREET
ncbi:hypothetical protein IV203_037008 [Nitzschia inconspicua]|uniref:ATP synthase protein I n=1 Tax=Nitzschia inconspicua TaxID=303405 RepID=A0A9K3K783_9STRA|nr:hypothetical protein IV203_037008 [Nitzschia inconspicua]